MKIESLILNCNINFLDLKIKFLKIIYVYNIDLIFIIKQKPDFIL